LTRKKTLNLPHVFDGHNDTLTHIYLPEKGQGRSFFERSEIGHIDLPRAKEGGLQGGICAVYTGAPKSSPESDPFYKAVFDDHGYRVALRSPIEPEYARQFTASVIELLHQLQAESQGALGVVHSYRELTQFWNEGKFAVVLHIEGAAVIREDLSNLEDYYNQGVRSLGPVWSRPNVFGTGVPFEFPSSPDTGPGLTEAGKRLVQECNRLGILVDLAHLNEKGFWDAAEISQAPLVVSHAGVHALCPSTRNLTDAQIDEVAQSGGLIGIIFGSSNIRPDGKRDTDTPLIDFVRHFEYVIERVGVDHVAFGSDFDGTTVPEVLKDVTRLPNLLGLLYERGWRGEDLEKIAYKNWFRVFQETWKES
jgi:membrane dipeptidase